MKVQMLRDARAGGGADVPTDIKSFSLNDLFEQTLGITSQIDYLDFFSLR